MSIPPSPADPLSGCMHQYPTTKGHSYPYFESGDLSSRRAVVFIGGLFDGLGSVGFTTPLSRAIEAVVWKMITMHWSGAYEGFGTGSLDRNVREMGDLVQHLRTTGHTTIVCMGHSTGSQGVIRYLTVTAPSPHLPTSPLKGGGLPLPAIDGGIMQAPVSDREAMFGVDMDITRAWRAVLPEATELVLAGKAEELLSANARQTLGMVATGYSIWTLGDKSGDDDYFSTDLPDAPGRDGTHTHPLNTSFGALRVPVLAVWSGKDEYARPLDQIRPLLRRWQAASNGRLEAAVLEHADHAVTNDKDRVVLCDLVVVWLKKHFGDTHEAHDAAA